MLEVEHADQPICADVLVRYPGAFAFHKLTAHGVRDSVRGVVTRRSRTVLATPASAETEQRQHARQAKDGRLFAPACPRPEHTDTMPDTPLVIQPFFAAFILLASQGARQAQGVIVLDFDEAQLHHLPDEPSDPDRRTTPFGECAGIWEPLRDAEREGAIAEQVQAIFSDFNVVVVTGEPPCNGPYIRVVVGPFEGCGAGAGYAEGSCSRTIGHGIVYARLGDDEFSVAQASALIAHEVGHAFGLAHVDDPSDIMHRSLGTGQKTFVDRCNPLDSQPSGQACQLVGWCPALEPLGQNSYFGLMNLLGPSSNADGPACTDALDTDDDIASCGCRSADPSGLAVLLVCLLCRSRGARARL